MPIKEFDWWEYFTDVRISAKKKCKNCGEEIRILNLFNKSEYICPTLVENTI
jgi:formamidopyrimidine-DNA glycosylase